MEEGQKINHEQGITMSSTRKLKREVEKGRDDVNGPEKA